MKRRSGFTLIEAAIVMAVVGLLAAVAAAALNRARQNSSAGATAYEISLRLQGLKTRALQEQKDYAAVFINPTGDDAAGCRGGSLASCARLMVLAAPPATWTLGGFDSKAPGLVVDDHVWFDREIVLDAASAGVAAGAPFGTITQLPSSMQASCSAGSTSGLKCFAIRFGADGTVSPIYPGAAPPSAPTGISLGITSDATGKFLRSHRRAVLITFPTGIVKTYPY